MPIRIDIADRRITSSVGRMLEQELRAYRDGKIQGRSFLIAGHRGAGKTSLVNHALRVVDVEALTPDTRNPRRFLPILIHGPSLLPTDDKLATAAAEKKQAAAENGKSDKTDTKPEPAGSAGAAEPAEPKETKKKAEASKTDALLGAALEQIVLALYRSLVDELTLTYRKRALDIVERDKSKEDLLERAAQLQLELDEYATPERLREFWAAGGFLQKGVLFHRSQHANLEDDQGLRELVALTTACEAYRRVSGTFEKAKEEQKEATKRSRESRLTFNTNEKDLLTPLIALATGGVVGMTAAASRAGSIESVMSGLVAALGTSAVFSYSSVRGQRRSFSREYTFLPNKDVATLDRALPALVQRLHDARLVPIFVVDELDKVDDLHDRMARMVGQLKKFVSERAFFCFLTNRDYYEHLQALSLTETYPIEHTYFTDRLFVVFRPDDLHKYLESIFVVPGDAPEMRDTPSGQTALAAVSTPVDGAVVAPAAQTGSSKDSERAIAKDDNDVLPYVLLQRAQMHTIDVRRQIDEIRAADDQVGLAPGSIRTHLADRFDMMMQLAIRMVMDRSELRAAMEREPAFSRLAYDALYYPTRQRRKGVQDLDLSDTSLEKYRSELVGRMASETDRKRSTQKLDLSPTEAQFLFARTREMAELLTDPFAFCDAMQVWERDVGRRLTRAVRDALPFMLPTGPLLSGSRDGSYTYRWGYDHLGRLIGYSRRTALAYQFDVEYELAVRMVLARDTRATNPDLRRILRAVLWLPYLLWQKAPGSPVDLHTYTDERLQRLIRELAPAIVTQVEAVFPRKDDLRARLLLLFDLLANPATFQENLMSEGWTARYPLITRELRPHSPVVAGGAVRPTSAFSWQFDLDGTPLNTSVQVPVAFESAPWEQQVHFIRGAEASLRRATNGELSFSNLGSGFNIIPVSPAWSEVEAAIRRLQETDPFRFGATEADPGDIAIVGQFGTLLARQGETIALAVAGSAITWRAGGRTGIATGLRAIVKVYDLTAAQTRPVQEVLTDVLQQAQERWPDLRKDLLAAPTLEPSRVADWESWMSAQVQSATRVVDPDPADSAARAWKTWNGRIESLLAQLPNSLFSQFSQTPRFAPTIDDVICAVSGVAPDSMLRLNPGMMSIYDWSSLLIQSLRDHAPGDEAYVPTWIAPVALSVLGYSDLAASLNVEKLLRVLKGSQKRPIQEEASTAKVLSRLIEARVQMGHAANQKSVLVLYGAPASLTNAWQPGSTLSMIAASPRDAVWLLSEDGLLGKAAGAPVFTHVLLEGVGKDDQVAPVIDQLDAIAKDAGRSIERLSLGGVIAEMYPAQANTPDRRARELNPVLSLEELVEELALPVGVVPPVIRALGKDAGALPESLRQWLAQPNRSAQGSIELTYWITGLTRWLTGLEPGVQQASYQSAVIQAGSDPGGLENFNSSPEVRSLLEQIVEKGESIEETQFDHQGGRSATLFRETALVSCDNATGNLLVFVGDYSAAFGTLVERDGFRLASSYLRPSWGFKGFVARTLKPRADIWVRRQEGGIGVEAILTITRWNIMIARINGDFALASRDAPSVTP